METKNWQIEANTILGDRKNQEDAHAVAPFILDGEEALVFALADGMGGYEGGAEASRIAVTKTIDHFLQNQSAELNPRLSEAVMAANASIAIAKNSAESSLRRMGCTIVLCCLTEAGIQWASVGDSPLWRSRKGRLLRLNQDHSMGPVLDQMAVDGEISAEEAASDPNRNFLRAALNGESLKLLDVSNEWLPIPKGDFIIAASDGLLVLTEGHIEEVLGGEKEIADVVTKLLGDVATVEARGLDNTTLVVCRRRGGWFGK